LACFTVCVLPLGIGLARSRWTACLLLAGGPIFGGGRQLILAYIRKDAV